jgi:hypothetical protein
VTQALVDQLLAGVQLHDEPAPLAAQSCVQRGEHQLEIVLEQGKYHQVKRMLAAAGNHCAALHRSQIGGLTLESLGAAEGEWCFLEQAQLDLLVPDVMPRLRGQAEERSGCIVVRRCKRRAPFFRDTRHSFSCQVFIDGKRQLNLMTTMPATPYRLFFLLPLLALNPAMAQQADPDAGRLRRHRMPPSAWPATTAWPA